MDYLVRIVHGRSLEKQSLPGLAESENAGNYDTELICTHTKVTIAIDFIGSSGCLCV